ncbi:MAG: hypothetical protein LRY55_07905, partial [Leadbetterella sp.]|nr:hypothetical protein [Leadbetterella sp.]
RMERRIRKVPQKVERLTADTLYSHILEKNKAFWVLLPRGYEKRHGATRSFICMTDKIFLTGIIRITGRNGGWMRPWTP